MYNLFEQLPWRVAALAGIIIGSISWYYGADFWVVLERMGMAIAVFFWSARAYVYLAADESRLDAENAAQKQRHKPPKNGSESQDDF